MTEDKVLTGLASLTVILLVGAVFGRLHGASGDKNAAIGDRVMCGLLALPLIALAIRLAFPASPFFWALLGPSTGVDLHGAAGDNRTRRHEPFHAHSIDRCWCHLCCYGCTRPLAEVIASGPRGIFGLFLGGARISESR
jgi:hypothetical protein